MAEASPETVRGDFSGQQITVNGVTSSFARSDGGYAITTDGRSGELSTYRVRYVFGAEPLQQYLLETQPGRLQASALAWDSRPTGSGGQRWFHLQPDAAGKPDDVLHWTGGAFNWNNNCADCHSTAVRKNYDPSQRRYVTEYAEENVGCEACHGAGSAHVESPAVNLTAPAAQSDQVNTCAQCHSRRSQLAAGFVPGADYFNHYLPALLDQGLYHADGQILDEVYVYGSFLQSKMHQAGVTCGHCHEPHTGDVRLADNALCTQCHNPAGRNDFPTLQARLYDDPAHHFHNPGSEGARCVGCHMPEQTYMQIDPRRDHSFRVPQPALSLSTSSPNACTQCHQEQTPQWAQAELAKRNMGQRAAHYGEVLAAARQQDPAVEEALGALGRDRQTPAIVRATALALMASYGRGFTSQAIDEGLRDAEPLVRIGAIRGAQRFPAAARWQRLQRLLNDPLLAIRAEATRVLLEVYGELPAAAQRAMQSVIAEYESVLAFNADQPEAQSMLASLHLLRGDTAGAERALNEALVLNPSWVPALVNLADLYRQIGRDDEGGQLLEQAMALAPQQADVLLSRGLWLVRQQRQTEALDVLRGAYEVRHRARHATVMSMPSR